MADRADPADARRDGRHLIEGPPFGEFLEPTKLRDMERRVDDLAVRVEVDRDFRMTFDAGDRVNDNGSGRGCGHPTVH